MADHRNINAKIQPTVPVPPRTDAARDSVAGIVQGSPQRLDPVILKRLHAAVLSPFPETASILIRELVLNGARPFDLADFYIPAVARELGDQWCIDELGFAQVTIGSSRLQAMLRALGPNWSGGNTAPADATSILLIVPQEIYHTLGALVLAGQLRRNGMSVKLVIGEKAQDIAARVDRTLYDAVFISSSRGESLESLRQIVAAVKNLASSAPPVVVGGSILEVETPETIVELTGADYATKNPDEALRLCGHQVKTHDDLQIKSRT